MLEQLEPWPDDAVMIVAALAGHENLATMEAVQPASCRRCGRTVHADTRTIRRAENLPPNIRRGRPIMFFCWNCHLAFNKGGRPEIHHGLGKDIEVFR